MWDVSNDHIEPIGSKVGCNTHDVICTCGFMLGRTSLVPLRIAIDDNGGAGVREQPIELCSQN